MENFPIFKYSHLSTLRYILTSWACTTRWPLAILQSVIVHCLTRVNDTLTTVRISLWWYRYIIMRNIARIDNARWISVNPDQLKVWKNSRFYWIGPVFVRVLRIIWMIWDGLAFGLFLLKLMWVWFESFWKISMYVY